MQAEASQPPVSRALLCPVQFHACCIPNGRPEVRLPGRQPRTGGQRTGQRSVRILIQAGVDGVPTVCGFPADAQVRDPARPGHDHPVAGLNKPLGGRMQIRIGYHGLLDQAIENRIVEHGPPIRSQFII